jgi:hypothetical protein
MIYLFCGDRNLAYLKAQKTAGILLQKQPDANLVKINFENYSDSLLEELIKTQGLFVMKNIILASGLFSDIKSDFLKENLSAIQDSENVFILIDGEMSPKEIEEIEKLGGKVQKFQKVNSRNDKKDNKIFEITDLFGRRDKKNLWIKYQELLNSHESIEILNILWWQVKAIKSAMVSKSATDSGLASYTYTKSKSFSRNFSEKEIDNLIVEILNIQNESFHSSDIVKEKLEILFLKSL